jgi:hypothetical protein
VRPVPSDASCHSALPGQAFRSTAWRTHISISDARAFGLAVKTRGANVPPAIEHEGSPSFLCLYLEREDIAPPAFVANWSDHAKI